MLFSEVTVRASYREGNQRATHVLQRIACDTFAVRSETSNTSTVSGGAYGTSVPLWARGRRKNVAVTLARLTGARQIVSAQIRASSYSASAIDVTGEPLYAEQVLLIVLPFPIVRLLATTSVQSLINPTSL